MRLGPSIFHPEPPKSATPIAQEAQPAAHCRAREAVETIVTTSRAISLHAGRFGLGAVPTLRKWNERPRQLVIRDGFF